ncbi:MAG: hypothetical protein U0T81_09220 [Saprospiraceae bacterium]
MKGCPEGSYKMDVEMGEVPEGICYIRVQTGIYQQVKNILKVGTSGNALH